MDRLAGCNYYLDNGIQHFKHVASQTIFTNLLQITKRKKIFFETWHEFFAQLAAAKLKLKATISCFLQTCAHKLDEEQRSTNCTCWIFCALVQSKKNTITCHSTIITRKTSLNKEDWIGTPFFSPYHLLNMNHSGSKASNYITVHFLTGGKQFQVL